jgi:flagellar biosynthesis/type III secretory pathway M-ring protein FliF/YscJ
MRDRYIPAFITLLAGAITCIVDIYRKANLLSSLKRLLLVLIIFYIIGLIARAIIRKVLDAKPNRSDQDIEDNTEDNLEDNPENIIDDNTEETIA